MKPTLKKLSLILCMMVLSTQTMAAGNTASVESLYAKMPGLDEQFQSLSNEFYTHQIRQIKIEKWDSVTGLPLNAESLSPAMKIKIIAGIKNNLALVCDKYLSDEHGVAVRLLYANNETATLRSLTDCVNKKGDPVAKSENYFLLAKYYYARKNWKGVHAALAKLDIKDLSVPNGHYAELLKGYVLQAQKKHRDSVKIYKRIPSSSPYYVYAKLNEGTAYLRQGWWTEAHHEFKQAIANNTSRQNQDFTNRIYVVLGFSQLHHEFYRDARDSLRNVSLDSAYTNRALMGLGLAAAYQEDYKGALNAFNRLATNHQVDLTVDESYLLVPNTYEELGDVERASEAYLKAINFYKNRIQTLSLAKVQLNKNSKLPAPEVIQNLESRADELYGATNLIPEYMVNNYHMIYAMKAENTSKKITRALSQLEAKYDGTLKQLIQTNITLRESILNSYLSQAKYGVAKLYDQP